MASNRDYINLLPDEVLCMVFDRLDLANVKNASLTCRRWNHTIFLSGYVDRFWLLIRVVSSAVFPKNTVESFEKRVKLLARNTHRRYRHFVIVLLNGFENAYMNVWKVIHPKMTIDIRSLVVVFVEARMTEIVPMIFGDVPSMLKLQALFVWEKRHTPRSPSEICQDEITIRSKSVKKLTMMCSYRHTLDVPRLEEYIGPLSAIQVSGDSSQPQFAKMKKIVISGNGWKSINPSVFQQMPCLEYVGWNKAKVEAGLIVAMIEMCPLLNSFHFDMLSDSDLHILKHLLKLNRLRLLRVNALIVERDLFFDASKLIHLEEFYVGSPKVMPSSLLSLSKSLTSLGVKIDSDNDESLMKLISCNFTHLKQLELVYGNILCPGKVTVSKHVLTTLPYLKNLEVLWLVECYVPQSFFLGMNEPVGCMRTLLLEYCRLGTEHLLGLQETFPNLKKLKFSNCYIGSPLGHHETINHEIYAPFAL